MIDDDRPLRAEETTAPLTLTPEQEAAVTRVGGTTLVAAAAGSGKTRVLTERVVRAVTEIDEQAGERGEPAEPRATLGGVLAITFTEKAAGELRERIRRGLERSARPELAREVEQATIGTIHAFCAGLLRRHALAAGLDPRFTVLDERRARTLRATAWSDALASFLSAGGDPALDLLAAHGVDPVHEAITAVHDDLRSQTGATRLPPVAPADPGPAVEALRTAAHAALADVGGAPGNGTVERATDALADCVVLLDGLAPGALPDGERLARLAVKAGNVKRLKEEPYQAYLAAHEACLQALTDAEAVADYELLDDLLSRYAARYAAAKAQVGGLDFDDLELRARDLLREHPAVADRVRGRYACILVDEFQDTNPVQLELVRALGGEDVFLVGDAFQSIYAFRHADVRVFRAVQDELRATGGALDLAGNFRSDPRIITAINAAFTRLFDHTFVPMVGRGAAGPTPAQEPVVELLVTDGPAWGDAAKGDDPPDLGSTLPRDPVWRRAEARLLAQRLHDLLRQEPELRPGHIAILVRARNSMDVIQQALADVGLDTLVSGSRGYWSHPQVADLVGWLRLLANPRDELTLWHVLRSPIVGVSTDTMALLALAARERQQRPWDLLQSRFAPAREEVAGPERLDDPLQFLDPGDLARLDAVTRRLVRERASLARHSLAALVDRIVRAARYDAYVLTLADGERRLAAVRKLQRLANAHEAAEGRDLRRFLDVIAEEQEAGDREPEAPIALTDDDAIQVMTIHAAKGLEFDVVAVFDVGRQENRDGLILSVSARPPARTGLRTRRLGEPGSRRALAYSELADEALEAARAEDRRLIYVALTRARRRLLVSGTLRLRTPAAETDALLWLGPALDPDLLAQREDPAAPVHREIVVADGAGSTPLAVVLSRPPVPGEEAAIRPEMLAPSLARERASPAPAPAPLAPVADRPAPPGAVSSVSFTSLSEYRECPSCFRLARILGTPVAAVPPELAGSALAAPTAPNASRPPDGAPAGPPRSEVPRLDALARGRVVHALLEDLIPATAVAPTRERARALVAGEAAAAGGTGEERDVDELHALVTGFLDTAVRERLAAAPTVRFEQPFAYAVAEDLPVVNGVLDVIATEDDGTRLIVDYKTNRVAGRDLAAIAREDYGLQRDIYALAALRAGARAVEVVYVFLERPHEPVTRRFDATDTPDLEAGLRALLEPLAAGAFPVGPAPHGHRAAWCPGAATP